MIVGIMANNGVIDRLVAREILPRLKETIEHMLANYLVCGDYSLKQSSLHSMVLATKGRMHGYEQPLKRGKHPFTLYGHVEEVAADSEKMLSILVFIEEAEYAVVYLRIDE